jgi:hypothetical protein
MNKDSEKNISPGSVKVTFCKNAKSPGNVMIKDSGEVLSEIRNGTWKGLIEKLNSYEYDSPEQKEYKETLPGIAWSGIFTYRSDKKIQQHSGLVCLDFDKIPEDQFQTFRDQLRKDEYTYSLFRSSRMVGLKCIVRIPPEIENHRKYFDALKEYFDSPYFDSSCINESRLCFVSYDPDLFFNPDSEVWNIKKEFDEPETEIESTEEAPQPLPTDEQSKTIFKKLIKWELNKNNIYEDGKKYKFLLSLLSACNRFGLKEEIAVDLTYTNFKDYPGTEYVKKEDFLKLGRSVYHNFKDEFNTAKLTATAPRPEDYIRVGINYFKTIRKPDRYEIQRTEMKTWNKETILLDHGKDFLKSIPKYDDFIIIPDNFNHSSANGNYYNLYNQFPHIPAPGGWEWTRILLDHVFKDQYELGIRYLQILYVYPKKIAPILVLVSKIRQTGKTTFVNWINMIFGGNVANITPEDLANGFNSAYATSNIISIEETLIEKSITIEKLKALATGKFISVNQKFISQYRLPFFGKIILTSNNEDKFAKIEEEEIRFFIRKLGIPEFTNHAIEDNLKEEIPAFLHYLTKLPPVDFSKDRSGFTPEELDNEFLKSVKEESRSWLCKELIIHFIDLFDNNNFDNDLFYADAISIKYKFYSKNNQVDLNYIRKTLKEELHLEYLKESTKKRPLDNDLEKQGRFYIVNKKQFINYKT